MSEAKVWVEKVTIPTYEIGEAEKTPMFLEKRVYQGSSGKVYPYATIETISDQKKDKEYTAVYLENEYIKVMVLPELGGRIQRAYDKTNDYDFVYYNQVIKPALVGLTGPWISGGIEFNWPQHHRPTTFLPVDYVLDEAEDGSKSVLVHDVDQMYGTKGIAKFTLYPGKAYIEITGQLYNRTPYAQTFLWWANPAVAVNENTQSIFPPDVHAVMDHGKRDVSRFPIATGVYYKHDYSEGVDISRYKNIPVPTSYMAEKSNYDFVGGYDYAKEAGILHVADHHISPGKKQWTWGCGDFGKAWDRNLTDEDGPYIELMTGVFTDNQPDFTWLKPFEEKTFKQYFMPYKEVGQVKNATKEAACKLECADSRVSIVVYATALYENATVILHHKGETVFQESATISPTQVYKHDYGMVDLTEEELELQVLSAQGDCLVKYHPEKKKITQVPEPAKPATEPSKILTIEELYLTGLHIEQYRHATYQPDDYYLEGLKRDSGDIRINNAYSSLLMRRGRFDLAETYLLKALERLTERNPNPYHGETLYLLGVCMFYQNRIEDAYDYFYKASWSNEQQEMAFYYIAAIDARSGKLDKSLEHVEKALIKNSHNIKARALKAWLLRRMGKQQQAFILIRENLTLDPFDFVSGYEEIKIVHSKEVRFALKNKMRDFHENYLMAAKDYAEFGAYEEAVELLDDCPVKSPMIFYYKAFYQNKLRSDFKETLVLAENHSSDYCFPNKLEDIEVLKFAMSYGCEKRAPYYLGNLFYDKMQWQEAIENWELSAKNDANFAIVHRNLSLAYYNKLGNREMAKKEMELALKLEPENARIFLELDQLYKKLNWDNSSRLAEYEKNQDIIKQRDDLYIEYITLLNSCQRFEDAYQCLRNHHFHPWEGGEGKVTTQYKIALVEMAKSEMIKGNYDHAEDYLGNAFTYPENLGEGKLEGTKDNHIHYYLGIIHEIKGDQKAAELSFQKANAKTDEPSGIMYYNDQPADMILYQGMAYLKLGELTKAKACFYRLIDFGERNLEKEVKIEYFAVSLPDFLIYEEDYQKRNQAHCNYLIALGNIGLGNREEALKYLDKTEVLEPSHQMCVIYKNMIQ